MLHFIIYGPTTSQWIRLRNGFPKIYATSFMLEALAINTVLPCMD